MSDESKTTFLLDECRAEQSVIDIHVVIEPGRIFGWERMDWPAREKALERWAAEVREFVRDHRSMDINSVTVVPITELRCSLCANRWDPVKNDETGGFVCDSCERPVAKAGT